MKPLPKVFAVWHFVTFLRRWCVMIVLGKTGTYLGVVEFFFFLEEGKDA
jgi:hypothetical protein